MPPMQRKKPTALRIDTPTDLPLMLAQGDNSSASTLSSAVSDSDYSPFNPLSKARSLRNMKQLSLNLPSAQSSSNSLHLPPSEPASAVSLEPPAPLVERPRRPSLISLPTSANPTTNSFLPRREEDGSPTVPYIDGPIQIIPGIWLGSEDNARDWKCLLERGIKSVLNVAKEVASPLDSVQPTRRFSSVPNLKSTPRDSDSTYYPPHPASGRPAMHYLKLQWSHGQQDLVEEGFPSAMTFVDSALERGEGVLVHCQCGISRSATMVIALVMRAAATRSTSVPPEIWALKGYQGAYQFVKEKSRWVGPNMSLIYQLLEYERTLKPPSMSSVTSDDSSAADEEEEWGRRRQMMEDASSDAEDDDRESSAIMREAQALDKAMEDRIVARKTSVSSTSSGVGMGAAWRSRYSNRKRTGSMASSSTTGSLISEDLVEEDEEQELLGVGGGFDDASLRRSPSTEGSSSTDVSPDDDYSAKPFTPITAQPRNSFIPLSITPRQQSATRPPPSAPVWKTSFHLPPPPATAIRPSFNLPTLQTKPKRRPPPLGRLAPMPPSPVTIPVNPEPPIQPTRPRTVPRKLAPPPLHLRSNLRATATPFTPRSKQTFAGLSTPLHAQSSPSLVTASQTQTLFVFPPEPSVMTRTPSTMTLFSNGPVPFPTLSTPRISTFRSHGRTRSFIGLGAPPTPTTACSRVDARGWVGVE